MSDGINKISGPGGPAGMMGVDRIRYPIITGRPTLPQNPPVTDAGKTFRELLESSLQTKEEVTFSKHAMARVSQRGVEFTQADLAKLSQAVGIAEEKGITDSLVLMNNTAFIVNVPNRVVVTVVDSSETEQNVFTNIDGAVIL